MKYRSDRVRQEFVLDLHPMTRGVVLELDTWSQRAKIPEPYVVDVTRSPAENAAAGGSATSWHLLACAVDLRVTHYSEPEHAAVVAWLVGRCFGSTWELITKVHGTGPHVHLAYRDFGRRKNPPTGGPRV